MITGEVLKHPGVETFRVLFVDEHNNVMSQVAAAIANELDQPRFMFSSAGLDPKPIDPKTVSFMKTKGFDLSRAQIRAFQQIPNLEYHQVVVALSSSATRLFPTEPRKTIYLDWQIADPSNVEGDETAVREAYETMFQYIKSQVTDLIKAIVGTTNA